MNCPIKKICSVICAFALAVSVTACGTSKALSKADLSIYDSNGKEVDFITEGQDYITLSDENKQKNGNFQTKQGIKIGERATDVLSKYDVSKMRWFAAVRKSDKIVQDDLEKSIKGKYKDAAEAITHSGDFTKSTNTELIDMDVIGTYTIDKNNNLQQVEVTDDGQPKNKDKDEKYYIIDFTIIDEKVSDVMLGRLIVK